MKHLRSCIFTGSVKQIIEIHKYDPDDDVTNKMMMWTKQRQQDWQDWRAQRKEDKASQALKDAVSHGAGASTNQMTCATILNIAKIRVKNDMTVMVSNLPNIHKLHGQISNKRNIRDIKRVRTKRALSCNRKRGTISGMNSIMAIRRTQSRKDE
jgi:uncharacterized protein YbcV (DUF1398 family)